MSFSLFLNVIFDPDTFILHRELKRLNLVWFELLQSYISYTWNKVSLYQFWMVFFLFTNITERDKGLQIQQSCQKLFDFVKCLMTAAESKAKTILVFHFIQFELWCMYAIDLMPCWFFGRFMKKLHLKR